MEIPALLKKGNNTSEEIIFDGHTTKNFKHFVGVADSFKRLISKPSYMFSTQKQTDMVVDYKSDLLKRQQKFKHFIDY